MNRCGSDPERCYSNLLRGEMECELLLHLPISETTACSNTFSNQTGTANVSRFYFLVQRDTRNIFLVKRQIQ